MTDIREKSAQFLADSLAAVGNGQDTASVASQLEEQIHAKHADTSNDYRGEIRNTGLTLKKDNPQLAAELLSGSITAAQLVDMSFEEMKSAEQAQKDGEMRQQNLDASIGVDELDPDQGYGVAIEDNVEADAEGDFKARSQPKVGVAMQGIEFETGQ